MDNKTYSPLLDVESVLAMLNTISIFAGLSKKQLSHLFSLLQSVSYKAGEQVFQEGSEPSHIYIVRTGKIKLFMSREGTNFELIVFDQGSCFGEASVLGIQPHGATALAMGKTELIVLSRSALMSIYETDLELFAILILNIAREVCRRLHASEEIMLHYVRKK